MQNKKFRLCLAVIDDLNDIWKIIEKATKFHIENDFNQWNEKYPTIETMRNDISNKCCYVLKDEDNIIYATVSLVIEDHDNSIIMLNRVAVNIDYKNMGIGTQLLSQIIQFAKANNFSKLVSTTVEKNIGMQKLFLKSGFTFIEKFILPHRTSIFYKYEMKLN